MFFWNSPSNNITVPNVMMYWSDLNTIPEFYELTITINSPNRTKEGQSTLNANINNGFKYQFLRIMMNFYGNSEWIFLSEVQFCGE